MAPLLAVAQGSKMGVGASGGMNMPLLQDDQKSGSTFEFRGRFQAVPLFVLEPKLSLTYYGSPDEIEGVAWDIGGSKITSYGVDAVLSGPMDAIGLKPFFVAGIGFYKTSNDDTENVLESATKFGWSAGLGFGIGVSPKFDVDVRGKAHVISHEGSSSKKSVALYGGLNYYFGSE